jgi:hypothetical protein
MKNTKSDAEETGKPATTDGAANELHDDQLDSIAGGWGGMGGGGVAPIK